jgi:hypothetical protein
MLLIKPFNEGDFDRGNVLTGETTLDSILALWRDTPLCETQCLPKSLINFSRFIENFVLQ